MTGTVSDPSGARVPAANILLRTKDKTQLGSALSDASGRFKLSVPAGAYELVISAPGFDPYLASVHVGGSGLNLDVALVIGTAESTVEVNGDTGRGSTAEDANGSALVLGEQQLGNLSDDDATFQQQLQALAGGDGQHAPQVYVNGFPGSSFPPKSAIREVRINQNPFSASYDQLGFGRIEILTKPGSGRLHGQFEVAGDPSAFNSRNPFLQQAEPPYYRLHTVGNVSGPLNKKTSFFLTADFYNQQNDAVVNAQTVNSSGAIVGISAAVPDPQDTSSYSAQVDTQWTANNTLSARYEFDRVTQTNAGLSQFVLPSEAYNSALNTSTLQLSNTQIVGAHGELNTKFQWIRTRTAQNPVSNAPALLVEGTVSDGGSPTQTLHDHQDELLFQEDGTYERGHHFWRVGVRYRLYRDANLSTAAYNGSFTFPDLASYQASVNGTPSASLFQITTGRPNFSVNTGDLGAWVEDEWKFRKNVTADLGFRFESQSGIPDHADPSPHLGLAWAIHQTDKKPARVVLRTGAAIFYDRFPLSSLLTTVRQSSASAQQTYTVQNPTFFASTAAQLQGILQQSSFTPGASTAPTTYRLAANLRSEYEVDLGATAEVSLGKYGSVSFNDVVARGIHQWYSRNANAPEADGSRPYGTAAGDTYEFASGGESLGTFAFANPEVNLSKRVQAWGFFVYQHWDSDVTGLTSFASNSYDVHQDYGRSPWDRRWGTFTGFDAELGWGLHLGTFLAGRGGQPFNITTGADNNGDTIYNDRPSYATPAFDPADVMHTMYGDLDVDPQPGEKIVPVDVGRSPRFVSLQARLQKTIQFGPRIAEPSGGPAPPPLPPGQKPRRPDPRYALVFGIEAQNITNTTSPAPPIGVLNSPFFGHSIATANSFLSTTAANRTFMLHTTFRF